MDAFAAALERVARLVDRDSWTQRGRLWIPPAPLTTGEYDWEDWEEDVALDLIAAADTATVLDIAFSLAVDEDRHPPAYELVLYLKWAYHFLESASFIRVKLTDDLSAYRGSESSSGMNCLLAATSQPAESDKEFLSFVFDQGGAVAGFEFIFNPPTHVVYPPAYTLDDLAGWITAGIAPHGDAIEMVLSSLGSSSEDDDEGTEDAETVEGLVRRYLEECADLTKSARGADDRTIIQALRTLVGYGQREDYFAKAVILRADEARNYYVQFAVDEGGLFCEVVHNKYLEPEHAFTGDDIAKLLALGFDAPDHEDQNLFRVFQPDSEDDFEAIVRIVRTVVTDFFGLPAGHPLTLVTSW